MELALQGLSLSESQYQEKLQAVILKSEQNAAVIAALFSLCGIGACVQGIPDRVVVYREILLTELRMAKQVHQLTVLGPQ